MNKFKAGQAVGFKADIECYGVVVRMIKNALGFPIVVIDCDGEEIECAIADVWAE